MKGFKYSLFKFIAEFILIVTGIILSFYIQGKIEDRSSRNEARHIMQQVLSDLISDTLCYSREINRGELVIANVDYLLKLNNESQLDTEEALDSFVYSFWFTTTNLKTPLHTAGYTRLIHFENKNIIEDDSLINSLISYYTIDKGLIDGATKLDQEFVDGPLIEAYSSGESYEVLNTASIGKPYADTFRKNILTFLENKQIRSLLIFNASNKGHFINNLLTTQESASVKIDALKQWLAKF